MITLTRRYELACAHQLQGMGPLRDERRQRMRWHLSWRADPRARAIADRHYNRQTVGAEQFVPPGRCLVLLTAEAEALWVTSWPFARYVKHAWPGAWTNSYFRNESKRHRASDLIREAVAATRWYFGDPPEPHGLVSFVDEDEIEVVKVRGKPTPGFSYLKAGFHLVVDEQGEPVRTKEEKHLVFQMSRSRDARSGNADRRTG